MVASLVIGLGELVVLLWEDWVIGIFLKNILELKKRIYKWKVNIDRWGGMLAFFVGFQFLVIL